MQLSIIIPVYNTGEQLRNTIESAIHQKGLEWELLLIDDGSTDEVTVSICDEYVKQYSTIRVIRQSNRGLCAARNIGLLMAAGEYVAFCDHDDKFCVDSMEPVFHFARVNNLDVVKYGYEFICLDKKPKFPFKVDTFFAESHVMNITEFTRQYPVFYDCGKLNFVWDGIYRKSFLQKHKIVFNDRFRYGQEDVDFCIQCCHVLDRFGYYNATCYIHYRYPVSTSRGLSADKTRQLISDFIYVFQQQVNLFEKLTRQGLANVYWQTIELRNILSLLAVVIKKECPLSFREKTKCLIELRRYFPNYQRAIKNTKGWSLKEKICYILFLKNPHMLIVISSLYARWLTYRSLKAQ